MMDYKYNIKAGEINLRTDVDKKFLDKVISFACRENPKRHFILINKRLGRYTPTFPSVMRETYDELAQLIGAGETTFVVSLAEAATGLGAGVADSLCKIQSNNVYFQHTTRHAVPKPVWFTLDEKHSHAVEHIFYQPCNEVIEDIKQAKRLVVIDDEITTGRTITVLLEKLMPRLTNVQEIVVASMMQLNEFEINKVNFPNVLVRDVSMIRAELQLKSMPDYHPSLPKEVNSSLSKLYQHQNYGRLGIKMPVNIKLNTIKSKKDTIIVADGEYQFIPFLIAEALENTGVNVYFQSINRSPISLCDNIRNKISVGSYDGDASNYLYNFFPEDKEVFVTSEKYYEGLSFHKSVKYHECV